MLRHYITRNGKTLRCGYTTGACAAGAAGAAARMLLTGKKVDAIELDTPARIRLSLDILDHKLGKDFASCAVRKDAGDDPDVTDGVLVYAEARRIPSGIVIEGGEGVGRVTKAGLDQPVGAAAINSVPQQMIREQVEHACRMCGYSGGVKIIISIPDGVGLASRTFNPRIGIEGGISVIGTTGIVEPMSSVALVDTISLELRVLAASGAKGVLLCPGRYGESFARETLGFSMQRQISIGNFIGDALDAAVSEGFERILLVGHIGKLVKLGIGMMNTHSAFGDGRMETLATCALEGGGDLSLLKAIVNCATTDAALSLLDDADLVDQTMAALGTRIQATLTRRVPSGVKIGFICFTSGGSRPRILTQSDNAVELSREWMD